MLKKRIIIPIILLISTYLICCNIIYDYVNKEKAPKDRVIKSSVSLENNYYAKVEIPKIGLTKELYSKENPKNNVDENITILEESELPNIENSILILAAHSGTGDHAYFNNIINLEKQDQIIIYYKKYKYYYEIDNIYEEIKNGKIHIRKKDNQNQIILTTCSITNKNKQLVISGFLLNKERET